MTPVPIGLLFEAFLAAEIGAEETVTIKSICSTYVRRNNIVSYQGRSQEFHWGWVNTGQWFFFVKQVQ